jgi:CheY-like chemotaxis protein
VPKLFSRKCALVYVDDCDDDHFLLESAALKTELPIRIQSFISAKPALAYLKGEPPFQNRRRNPFPALLLCDYDLKVSQGPEFVRAARCIPSCAGIPIIMFSNSDDQGCVLASYAAGADGYLLKPCDTSRLEAIVETLYVCAISASREFEALTRLEEFQHPPPTTGGATSVAPRRATSSR